MLSAERWNCDDYCAMIGGIQYSYEKLKISLTRTTYHPSIWSWDIHQFIVQRMSEDLERRENDKKPERISDYIITVV